MLTAKEIINENILKLDNSLGKEAQVGYDLSLKEVNRIGPAPHRDPETLKWVDGKIGMILKEKTLLTDYNRVPTTMVDGYEGWLLYPGTYDITFYEGCDIPENRAGFIIQRSSLKRNGTSINSPVFDPGFKTENMGTIMKVNETIFIERGARVAQMIFHETKAVDELYNGAWQEDKQRYKQP